MEEARRVQIIGVLILSLIVFGICPFVGTTIPFDHFLHGLSSSEHVIFFQLRIPRVELAFFIGGALSVCGLLFQGSFRNVLATPYTFGVSSGSALGVIAAIWLFPGEAMGGIAVGVLLGFLGALIASGLFLGMAMRHREFNRSYLLLIGVGVNLFLSNLLVLVQYLAEPGDIFRMLRWLMGGIHLLDPILQRGLEVIIVCVMLFLFLHHRALDLICVGDEFAETRGVNTKRFTWILFGTTSLLTGIIVSVAGPIGFVGILEPFLCRTLFGYYHRYLIPACFFVGGAYLVLCDTFARTVLFPAEIPVGVVTGFCGGPILLWFLMKRMRV